MKGPPRCMLLRIFDGGNHLFFIIYQYTLTLLRNDDKL